MASMTADECRAALSFGFTAAMGEFAPGNRDQRRLQVNRFRKLFEGLYGGGWHRAQTECLSMGAAVGMTPVMPVLTKGSQCAGRRERSRPRRHWQWIPVAAGWPQAGAGPSCETRPGA